MELKSTILADAQRVRERRDATYGPRSVDLLVNQADVLRTFHQTGQEVSVARFLADDLIRIAVAIASPQGDNFALCAEAIARLTEFAEALDSHLPPETVPEARMAQPEDLSAGIEDAIRTELDRIAKP